MSSPPQDGSLPQEEDGSAPKIVPRNPGLNYIRKSVISQIDNIYNTGAQAKGEILTFYHISPTTGQQVSNWYNRPRYNRQSDGISLNYLPRYRTIYFKFSHPAGAALVCAFKMLFTSWGLVSFRRINSVSKSIHDSLRIFSNQSCPTIRPVALNTTIVTPPLSFYPIYEPKAFPSIVLEYTFSPTSDPAQLVRHWHDLYRLRDFWFSRGKRGTQVVILALFYIDDEGSKKVQGVMDVWRYSKQANMGLLTDEVVLFPDPPIIGSGPAEETRVEVEDIRFTIQEIYGESCTSRFGDLVVEEDMAFVLDLRKLRTKMLDMQRNLFVRV